MMINGRTVQSVRRVVWERADSRELRTMVIIGRCMVELDDGKRVLALLGACTAERNLGDRYAILYDEVTQAFVAIAMDPEVVQ